MKEPPKRQYRKTTYLSLPNELPDRLLTIEEAAGRLRCSKPTIRRYVSQGRLTAYRVGPRMIRLDGDQVDRLARPITPREKGADDAVR